MPEVEVAPRCTCTRCAAHDSGRRGPYTTADFVELFGVVNEPGPVEVSADLATLGIAVDTARERYEAARDGWAAAFRSLAVAESTQSRPTGTPSPAERRAVEAARAEFDEAAEILGRAQVAYNSMARRLQERAAVDAYRAEQEALAAEREAARRARQAASQHRGLRAIRKVSRVQT